MIDINDLSVYHADLMSWDESPATVTICKDWPTRAIMPVVEGNFKTFKPIAVKLWIDADTEEQAELDISNFSLAICDSIIKRGDYYYHCTLDGKVTLSHEGFAFYTLSFNLLSDYKSKAEITSSAFSNSATIDVQGNLPSPATVKITPSQDIGTLTLSGLSDSAIIINNLHENNPVKVDGENCSVTENDLSQSITEALGSGKWIFRKYAMTSIFDPDTSHCPITPVKSMIPEGYYIQQLLTDKEDLFEGGGDDYLASFTTAVYVNSAKTITFCFLHDDGVNVFVDGVSKFSINTAEQDTGALPGKANFTVSLTAGAWHTIEILLIQHFGRDGIWNFTPTLSSQVDNLNCSYASKVSGTVNKFPDCDMSEFPTVKPGNNSISVDKSSCSVTVSYKPKFM